MELAQICRCSLSWPWPTLTKATAASGRSGISLRFLALASTLALASNKAETNIVLGEKQKKLRFVVLAPQALALPSIKAETTIVVREAQLIQGSYSSPLGPSPSTFRVSPAMKSGRCPGSAGLATALHLQPYAPPRCQLSVHPGRTYSLSLSFRFSFTPKPLERGRLYEDTST